MDDDGKTCDTPDSVLAFCLALLAEKFPDLATVAERWGSLTPELKTRIVALATDTPRA